MINWLLNERSETSEKSMLFPTGEQTDWIMLQWFSTLCCKRVELALIKLIKISNQKFFEHTKINISEKQVLHKNQCLSLYKTEGINGMAEWHKSLCLPDDMNPVSKKDKWRQPVNCFITKK